MNDGAYAHEAAAWIVAHDEPNPYEAVVPPIV